MPDIKLLRPERLTDNPDGGGLATSTVIVDGEINNVFDDVNRIDRTVGDLSLRKGFAIADTPDASTFGGLHLIIKATPQDPKVSSFLFRTDGWADTRTQARAAVERYVDPSVLNRMLPYDRQLQGQSTLLVWQRPELPLPLIGEVYCLSNQAATQFEFVRVVDLSHRVETFNEGDFEFQARVITLTLLQPLKAEWPGSQPSRRFQADVNSSVIRDTAVSNAARYYGTVPLAVDVSAGALTFRCETIYGQLVPAAVSESAVTDLPAAGAVAVLAAGEDEVLLEGDFFGVGGTLRLPTAIQPGQLRVKLTFSSPFVTDNGEGEIDFTGAGGTGVARVDYAAGTIDFSSVLGVVGVSEVGYKPAAAVGQQALSQNFPITLGNRGTVYIANLQPTPSPGSLFVDYLANGRWYRLQDDGTGALRGADVTWGVGTINFATGTATATLGALPDVGSSVVWSWAQNTVYEIRTQDVGAQVPEVLIDLDAGNCKPGTLSIAWESGGVARTATDNGAGLITGDATGRVLYSTGKVAMRPTLLPDSTAAFEVEYEAAPIETEVFNPTKSGADITITASQAIAERSVLITYSQTAQSGPLSISTIQQLTDSPTGGGAGVLIDADGNVKAGSSINYATGEITFNPDYTAVTPQLTYADFERGVPARVVDPTSGRFAALATFGRWPISASSVSGSIGFINGSAVTLQYKAASASDGAQTQTVAAPPIRVRLARGTSNTVVPGSVLFELGGDRYADRGGRLVRNPSLTTGAGLDAGSINYQTSEVALTSYAGGIAPALNVQALLTQVASLPLSVATGRTPGAPIRPGSFVLQANRYRDGALLTAIADQNGNIDTADMHGSVDAQTGVWSVAFGQYVLASGLSPEDLAAPWYTPDAIGEDGYIWRPDEAVPGSVRFSCVVQTTLPLSPEIIGVDTVRLPQDGRVQFVRAGDTLVIHNTQLFELPNPPTAGSTYALPRANINSAVLYDADGLGVDPALYTVDRVAGEVTMADPLDLSGYTLPLTALHSIEDMALCTDAQIDGTVSVAQPLSRSYSTVGTYVSSALVVGDVAARVANVFAQQTWTGVWSDSLIGTAPPTGATYNTLGHPIVVTNADSITQRWRIQFTGATTFNLIGEQLGVVIGGTTGADFAPINPGTGQPYFTIAAAGWGSGWANGYLLRFNTIAGGSPFWIGRAVQPGAPTVLDDRIRLEVRYDRD